MKKNVVRVLALVLVALMCLSLIPFAAHAEEHVHQFEPITVPATCQYNGYVQVICPICGAGGEIVSYLNELAPHSFVCVEDEQYVIEAGDCEHATQYWKSCSVCEVSAEEEYGDLNAVKLPAAGLRETAVQEDMKGGHIKGSLA